MARINIIFVEDEPISNADISEYLEEIGYSVRSFYCASSAIEAIDGRDYIAAALLTDINLGRGQDGFHVASHARSVYPNLPVVFVSAEPSAGEFVQRICGSVLVGKPFHPHQLVKALHQVIGAEAAKGVAYGCGGPPVSYSKPGSLAGFLPPPKR